MGVENVYIAIITLEVYYIETNWEDIIIFFNEKYPNNKLIIEKYFVNGLQSQTISAINNFVSKYPTGKRAIVSNYSSIVITSSNYCKDNNFDILNVSPGANSNEIKKLTNTITYAPYNKYSIISFFQIFVDYQMNEVKILYEANTPNDSFYNSILNDIIIQADLLGIKYSISYLKIGQNNYDIKKKSGIFILSEPVQLKNLYITPQFLKNVPAECFIALSESYYENIFGNIPAFVFFPFPVNYTITSQEVYNAVKSSKIIYYTIFSLYDILFVLNDFTTNDESLNSQTYISIIPYKTTVPACLYNSYLELSINGSLYGKYQVIFTNNIIIGNDIELFLRYYGGGQLSLPDSYSIFRNIGITPNNPSLIEYDESEYYKIYDNNNNLLCVRNNCNITNFPAIYDLNIGTTLYTKFIYEYNDDGYFSSLKRLYPYNGTIPEVNSTMSKIPIKLKYNVPNKLPTYLSSKAYIDHLLSQSEFIIIAELLTNTDPNSLEYTELYNKMNDYLSGSDSKYIVDIVSSDGRYLYCSEFESTATVNLPNQNTCPEVLASVNFLWGNPMINKTAFPIKPIYPAYIAPTISEGYGISDRYSSIFLKNLQFICKTWGGNDGPMNGSIFSLRVSQ